VSRRHAADVASNDWILLHKRSVRTDAERDSDVQPQQHAFPNCITVGDRDADADAFGHRNADANPVEDSKPVCHKDTHRNPEPFEHCQRDGYTKHHLELQ